MNKLTDKQVADISLPKWPQMRVWGVDVTEQQAMDILLRTDGFFTEVDQFGAQRRWEQMYRHAVGITKALETHKEYLERDALTTKVRDAIGFVPHNYVHNTWASSSYIYGAYGWCSPQGKIFYRDNIGKWPGAEEVLEDWADIAHAFPYLDAHVVLMNGEHCEEDTTPVMAIRVSGGEAFAHDDFSMPEGVDWSRDINDISAMLSTLGAVDKTAGNAVPDSWVAILAQRLRHHYIASDLGKPIK